MKLRSLLAGAATAALVLAPTAAFGQDATVKVSAVHGVPASVLGGNSAVDVYVYEQGGSAGATPTIEFEFGDVAGPLEIPAGDYTVDVYADGGDTSTAPVLTLDASLPAGANATIVAHLNADGSGAVLTPFVNDISTTAAGEARVTVRHTAAAPAVDVLTGTTELIGDLENPGSASLDTAAGTVPDIKVTAANAPETVALTLGDVTFAEGTNTIVYAIGILGGTGDDAITVAIQSIDGLHTAPAAVAAGSAGLADEGLPMLVLAGMLVGLALLAGPVVATARRRR